MKTTIKVLLAVACAGTFLAAIGNDEFELSAIALFLLFVVAASITDNLGIITEDDLKK